MESDWKPTVGGTAWLLVPLNRSVHEVTVIAQNGEGYDVKGSGIDDYAYGLGWDQSVLFPTAEAALESIRVYDLEGKEVDVPRDQRFSEEYALLREMVGRVIKWALEPDSQYDPTLNGLFEELDELVETQDMRIQIYSDPKLAALMRQACAQRGEIKTTKIPKRDAK